MTIWQRFLAWTRTISGDDVMDAVGTLAEVACQLFLLCIEVVGAISEACSE